MHHEGEDALIGRAVGNFVIERELGSGGMGTVYRATHREIGMAAAIKVLEPRLGADPEGERRFVSEAKVLASIDHPGVVRLFDFGRLDGRLYYVMEALEGRSLGAELGARAPLSPQVASELVEQIAAALEAAHQRGVVHRDLKPENVFVVAWQPLRLKLLDFGVAKLLEGEQSADKTKTGMIVGTPTYASPEQAAGRNDMVTKRTDIYALGAMLYTMLAGRPPFLGNVAATLLYHHIMIEPPALAELAPELPRPIVELVHRCLAKEPADRPPSAEAVACELRRAVDAAGPSAAVATTLAAPTPLPGALSPALAPTVEQTADAPSRPSGLKRGLTVFAIMAVAGAAIAGAVVAGAQLSARSKGGAKGADARGASVAADASAVAVRPAAGLDAAAERRRDAARGLADLARTRKTSAKLSRKPKRPNKPIARKVSKIAPASPPTPTAPRAKTATPRTPPEPAPKPVAKEPIPRDSKALLTQLRRLLPRIKLYPSLAREELKRNAQLGPAALRSLLSRWRKNSYRSYELRSPSKLRCIARKMKTRRPVSAKVRELWIQNNERIAGAPSIKPIDRRHFLRNAYLSLIKMNARSYTGTLKSPPPACR